MSNDGSKGRALWCRWRAWSWRRRLLAAALALYAIALAASYWVRATSEIPVPVEGRQLVAVRAVDGERRLEESVEVAYRVWRTVPATEGVPGEPEGVPGEPRSESARDTGNVPGEFRSAPGAETGGLPILLLHGSPGSADDFRSLGPALAEESPGRSIVALDFPGFGASTRSVPDYSVLAHAGYTLQVLDELGIERAHVVGFSMGGGVGLRLWQIAPERVESMVMIASIGVQELELLGSYSVNRLLHAAQLVALRVLRDLVPHFGFFDRFPLDVPYARNFYDTDQRPLRELLEGFEPPMLIVHGESDPLVPREAAEEHHRIVPQSELRMLERSHFFVFRGGSWLGPMLLEFFRRVESGVAVTRGRAEPARIEAAARPYAPSRLPRWSGPALPAVFLLLALGTLISEDLSCIAAGLLVAQGRIDLSFAILACYVGIVGGDLLLFWGGRSLGRKVLHRAPLRWWISERAIDESSLWLRKRGPWVILITRVLPGARLPTNVAAGVLHTDFWKFLLYFAAAGAFWTPVIVGASALVGESLLDDLDLARGRFLLLLVALGALMFVVRHLAIPLLTWRGRRRLAGRLRRLRRWEFWPSWAIYPPVLVYLLSLGLRYRSLTLFTCVNPMIPLGGFHGESKAAIYRCLPPGLVPRWVLVEPGELETRVRRVQEFMEKEKIELPIVLKPDAGERGRDVAIARSEAQIRDYLANHLAPTLAQQFVAGEEYGVFWIRGPAEPEGEIFGINAKATPELVGDGESTLERLILEDERAATIADVYLAENPDAKDRVPEPGERVPLTEIGAHSRGTVFLEATNLRTEALRRALGRLADQVPGFDFGRLDLRVESREDLQRGGPFQILEVNGVTSEATNLYDPAYSLFDALRILCRQWRRAFEVGDQRRRLGAKPARLRRLIGAWWRERRRRAER